MQLDGGQPVTVGNDSLKNATGTSAAFLGAGLRASVWMSKTLVEQAASESVVGCVDMLLAVFVAVKVHSDQELMRIFTFSCLHTGITVLKAPNCMCS